MLTVTPSALAQLKTYLSANNIESSLRVTLLNGGCSGMSLGLAIDEKKESDRTITFDEVIFLVEESLLLQTGKILIDFVEKTKDPGFAISSEKQVGGGGCGSGSCSSGNCG